MARSRYSRSSILDDYSYETFTLNQTNAFKEVDTFDNVQTIEYVVKAGDRLDTLAAKFLHEDQYWWVIALINNLTMPTITPGQKIKIPIDASDVLNRI